MGPDDAIAEMSKLMQGVASMGMIDRGIATYDQCALAAMQSLVGGDLGGHPKQLAEVSWEIADAMMVERAKRGLGGPQQG